MVGIRYLLFIAATLKRVISVAQMVLYRMPALNHAGSIKTPQITKCKESMSSIPTKLQLPLPTLRILLHTISTNYTVKVIYLLLHNDLQLLANYTLNGEITLMVIEIGLSNLIPYNYCNGALPYLLLTNMENSII